MPYLWNLPSFLMLVALDKYWAFIFILHIFSTDFVSCSNAYYTGQQAVGEINSDLCDWTGLLNMYVLWNRHRSFPEAQHSSNSASWQLEKTTSTTNVVLIVFEMLCSQISNSGTYFVTFLFLVSLGPREQSSANVWLTCHRVLVSQVFCLIFLANPVHESPWFTGLA